MTFHAFGLNHQTAPVMIREAFALTEERAAEVYGILPAAAGEVILLSTCNRTEVYLFGSEAQVVTVREALCRCAGRDWPVEHAFHLRDEDAIMHVLRVAAGVASQVLGDGQILAQMKQSYRMAVEAGHVGTVLHRLMHTAFRTAKRVRSETTLTDGAASVSSVAVQAARMHFETAPGEPLARREVLLVGLGQMGLSALRALRALGVQRIMLANRSRERAQELAAEFEAQVIEWEDRHRIAGIADLVLVASGAPEPVLLAEELPQRTGSPALVVDVAIPRNVDPRVAGCAGYQLVDLDALNRWLEEVVSYRAAAVPAAEAICLESLQEFVSWVMHHEARQPALHALRDTFEAIRQEAIRQHGHRFREADREQLEALTQSILQKLLAVPIVRLKATEPDSLDFARGVRFLSHVFSRPGCEAESARDATAGEEPLRQRGADTTAGDVAPTADATRDAWQ
jgi:glutamyl-tRNA reductase